MKKFFMHLSRWIPAPIGNLFRISPQTSAKPVHTPRSSGLREESHTGRGAVPDWQKNKVLEGMRLYRGFTNPRSSQQYKERLISALTALLEQQQLSGEETIEAKAFFASVGHHYNPSQQSAPAVSTGDHENPSTPNGQLFQNVTAENFRDRIAAYNRLKASEENAGLTQEEKKRFIDALDRVASGSEKAPSSLSEEDKRYIRQFIYTELEFSNFYFKSGPIHRHSTTNTAKSAPHSVQKQSAAVADQTPDARKTAMVVAYSAAIPKFIETLADPTQSRAHKRDIMNLLARGLEVSCYDREPFKPNSSGNRSAQPQPPVRQGPPNMEYAYAGAVHSQSSR